MKSQAVKNLEWIASVTRAFCKGTRARLTADRKLAIIVFSDDRHDLKSLMRMVSDKQLIEMIRSVRGNRTDRYSY